MFFKSARNKFGGWGPYILYYKKKKNFFIFLQQDAKDAAIM